MYATIEAFIPADLEYMHNELWALKDKYLNTEGKDSLQDQAEEQMRELEQFVNEYRNTWYVSDGLLVLQERDLLYQGFVEKLPEVKRSIADWEESKEWDEWHQVSGDVNASDYGAWFCRADKWGYEFVEIILYDEGEGNSYWAEENYVSRDSLDSEHAEDVKRSWGRMPDEEWTSADIALAMAEYGGYRSGNAYKFKTLAEAMDQYNIPKDALWQPEEYDKVPVEEEEEEEEVQPAGFPGNPNMVYCQQCGNYLTEDELSVYPFQWQHSGDMYCARHETRAQFKTN